MPPRKNKVYGKQRRPNELDLVASLDRLRLTPPCKEHDEDKENQKPLPLPGHPLHPHSKSTPPRNPFEEVQPVKDEQPALPGAAKRKDSKIRLDQKAIPPVENGRLVQTGRQNQGVVDKSTLPACEGASRANSGERTQEQDIMKLLSIPDIDPEIMDFCDVEQTWTRFFQITKIGQGSFAAIFRLQLISDPSQYTVWKLLPLRSGETQMNATLISDAATEVKALAAMSRTTGFVEFRSARVLRGRISDAFRQASEIWTEDHGGEDVVEEHENDQLWLFIEMTDAGTDLERILEEGGQDGVLTIGQVWDIFWGVSEALAHGEDHAEFEHRDLHPGNICIKNFAFEGCRESNDNLPARKQTPLEVTIIDYTLSRARLENGETLFNPMEDQSLFEQSSEVEADKAQYELYRTMRALVPDVGKDGRAWRRYMPATNVLWLSHLLTILLWKMVEPVIRPAQQHIPNSDLSQRLGLLQELQKDLVRDSNSRKLSRWRYKSANTLWADSKFHQVWDAEGG